MSLTHLFKLESEKENELFEKGVRFGKSLQMINILRDIPSDLALDDATFPEKSGRTQIESTRPIGQSKMESFRPLYDEYLDLTKVSGVSNPVYRNDTSPQFRLRGSCMLPVIIGKRTVSLLRTRNVLDRKDRIKIDRI